MSRFNEAIFVMMFWPQGTLGLRVWQRMVHDIVTCATRNGHEGT